jgi:hypothetical protein
MVFEPKTPPERGFSERMMDSNPTTTRSDRRRQTRVVPWFSLRRGDPRRPHATRKATERLTIPSPPRRRRASPAYRARLTVTTKLTVFSLPLVSIAEQRTLVRPTLNQLFDLGRQVAESAPSTSSRAVTE